MVGRSGWLMSKKKRIKSFVDRFWSKVRKTKKCWLWVGSIRDNGYGVISKSRSHLLTSHREEYAHRVSWKITRGPIPVNRCVLHKCDNRRCVRPSHLWLGTNKDNTHDMYSKGRAASGERHGTAKLTEKLVAEIRRVHAEGGATQRELSLKYEVSQGTINSVLSGKLWAVRYGDPNWPLKRPQVRRSRTYYRERRLKGAKPVRNEQGVLLPCKPEKTEDGRTIWVADV